MKITFCAVAVALLLCTVESKECKYQPKDLLQLVYVVMTRLKSAWKTEYRNNVLYSWEIYLIL